MINLLSDDLRRDPFPIYDELRTRSPVRQISPGVWMILDYQGVRRALQDHDTWSNRAAPPGGQPLDWLLFHDPPRHTKLRALVARAFTPRVVADLDPRIQRLSRELIDRTIERGEMDLCDDFAIPLPMMVIAEMIGIPADDWPRFKGWSDGIMKLSETILGGETAAAAAAAYRAATVDMRAYVLETIERRRAAPQGDLLTRLVEADVDGERLREDEIVGFFELLLVAGNDTTTNLISNAIVCLLEHPAELARLRAGPHLLPTAIEEVLRYRSPVQAVFRETRREVTVGGATIPAGTLALATIGSANRDPAQFQDPGRFDVTRDPNPHLALGQGAHFCMGAPLARLEARIALSDLLTRLPGLERATEGPWEPRRALNVLGPAHLPIRFEPGRRLGPRAG